jgi:hypothetical protein
MPNLKMLLFLENSKNFSWQQAVKTSKKGPKNILITITQEFLCCEGGRVGIPSFLL